MSDEFVAYVGDPIFMTARHAMTHIRRQERDDDKSIHGNLGSPSVTASTRPAPSEFSDALKGRRVGRFVRLRIPGMYTADGRNHASPCGESHGTASSDGPKPRRCSSAVGRCGPDRRQAHPAWDVTSRYAPNSMRRTRDSPNRPVSALFMASGKPFAPLVRCRLGARGHQLPREKCLGSTSRVKRSTVWACPRQSATQSVSSLACSPSRFAIRRRP